MFKLDTTGTETVLHSFTGERTGRTPRRSDPRLGRQSLRHYLRRRRIGRQGVVFKLDTTGTETVLYSFTGGADGANPYAGLIRDSAGNLYGTTYGGGTSNWGVVFKLDTTGTETVLHSFTGGADGGAALRTS